MSTTRTPRIAVLAILPLLLASLAGLASPAHAVAPGPELAWGDNGAGQLGDGTTTTTTSRSTPTLVCAVGASAPCTSYLHGITAIAAGRFQSFAIATPPAADLSVGLQISEVERLGERSPKGS